jgi:hypothetical protein
VIGPHAGVLSVSKVTSRQPWAFSAIPAPAAQIAGDFGPKDDPA